MIALRPTMRSHHRLAMGLVSRLSFLATLGLFCLPLLTVAQSFVMTNGVQTYNGLTNTTVTMTGRTELRLTSADVPLSGCLVHLNSLDAWLLLPNLKPSAVAASYLGQIRVNGAAAVADSNVRVVQYGMGTVVIPHPSTLQPLQIFSGPHFTGNSLRLNKYTVYNATELGAMNRTISSFKLTRGYMATIAENENGTGASRCYVAQDADLEVSLLPASLDNRIRFVRIFPWRWVSKKGVAGGIWQNLNVQWYYNWNLNQTSSRDLEYVAIRQTRWWPGLDQNWQTLGINHLLGYNEPDHPEQANMTVGDAIYSWPDLLSTGLRVGAPAVTDGGASWLYSFIDQADAAGLRVDFVPVHYYRCYSDPANPDGAATQFYNFLKGIYDRVQRPLWVTEWNNGADWTGCADPTAAQQQATVAKMIEMLDNTPFVERYAIYNWVEDVRRVQWDDGTLTAAGVTYRDKISPVSHVQALPDHQTRGIAQFWFENNTLDSSGFGNNGLTVGNPAFTGGHSGQALEFDGTHAFLQLPPNLAHSPAFSFAAWIYWNGGGNWQRIFDFGNDTSHYLFLTPRSGSSTLRFAIKNGGPEQIVETASLPIGQWHHVAVTLNGNTARLYLNGVLTASSGSFTIAPSSFAPRRNFLGESQFAADPLFNGRLDEVLITDYALTPVQVAGLLTNEPPAFASNLLNAPAGLSGTPYSGSIAGTATDPDASDLLTYSKATGPAWLTVGPGGTLGGTPAPSDAGTNTFTVRVSDKAGASAFAVLTIPIASTSQNGTWIADASGFWGTSNLWSGGLIADGAGFTADFSTINISANRFVTLDSPRTIGTLKFGDASANQTWTLYSPGGNALTLDTLSPTQPLIMVTNTAILDLRLAGTNGFLKTGPGTLILSGNNSLSGTLNIDSGSTTSTDGVLRLAGPAALPNVSTVQIRNNNNGSSTLQLDGSSGPITLRTPLAINCRNAGTATIQNLAGTNVLTGFIGLGTGGNLFNIRSDAGLLVFTGTNQYIGSLTGARSYAFSGAGDHLVSGPIHNSTNNSLVSLTKTGTGTLTLAGVNTYAGSTTVSGGTFLVNGALTVSPLNLVGTATLGGSGTLGGAVSINSGTLLSPGAPLQPDSPVGTSIGKLTANSNLTMQPGCLTRMEIAKPDNDQLMVAGTLTCGGALLVTNLSGALAAGDSFILFQAGAIAGSFSSVALPILEPPLAWDTSGLTNGFIRVVRSVATYPTNLTSLVADGSITLSWPVTHLGWTLQVQTNSLGTNWITVPGSESLDRWTLPFDPALQGLFFRLAYP